VDRRRVGDVEQSGVERVGIALDQIGDLTGVADGTHYAVATREELLGELAAKAAAHASD
jgi:hypothetical protein